MSSVNRISNGDTISVDVEEMVKKLDVAAGRLEKTLSRSQEALGISVDRVNRFVNAGKRCVDGLSLTQIRMGQWVDELGRVRTANEGFIADLNKIEIALGFYADAERKVLNAQEQFIRYTAQATRAMEAQKKAAQESAEAQKRAEIELSEARQRSLSSLSDGLSGISNATSQFSVLLATIGGATDTMKGFRAELTAVSQGFSAAFATAQSITSLVNSAKQLRDATKTLSGVGGVLASAATASGNATKGVVAFGKGCKTAALGAKALQLASGPLGIALAAISVGIMAWSASRQKNEVEQLSESFKELEERARKAGDSISNIKDALNYGAFRSIEPGEDLKEAAEKLRETREYIEEELTKGYFDKAVKYNYEHGMKFMNSGQPLRARQEYMVKDDVSKGLSYEEMYKSVKGTSRRFWNNPKKLEKAIAEYNNEMADYNAVVEKYVQAAREEQKTTEDRLNEQKQIYKELEKVAKRTGNKEAEETFRKQLESLDKKIAEAKEAQARAENEAAAKAQAEARRSSGIDQFLEKAPEKLALTIEAFEETKKKWREQAEQLGLDNEQIQAAIDNYEKAVKDATRSALAKDLGVDVAEFNEAAKEATDKFVRLKQALENEKIIDDAEYANLLSRLQTERAKELEGAASSAL